MSGRWSFGSSLPFRVYHLRCMRVKSPLHRVNVDMDCCPIERVKLGVPLLRSWTVKCPALKWHQDWYCGCPRVQEWHGWWCCIILYSKQLFWRIDRLQIIQYNIQIARVRLVPNNERQDQGQDRPQYVYLCVSRIYVGSFNWTILYPTNVLVLVIFGHCCCWWLGVVTSTRCCNCP